MAHTGVNAFISCAIVVAGCGGSTPAPTSRPASGPAASAEAPASFEHSRWGTYHSKRFELSLGLPDGSAWKIDDHHSPWLRAGHEATHSKLLLRTWSEDQNITRKGCYARARQWESALPLLEESPDDGPGTSPLIDDRVRKVMGDRDARVAVGVEAPGAPGAMTGGFVVAVFGSIRRCLVVAFQTEARGPSAADEVAGRLALVADRLLPSLKADQGFAPARETLMGAPVAPGEAGGGR